MSNGPDVSSKFAGRDVILVHHHGALQKPRLNFFQRRTGDAKETQNGLSSLAVPSAPSTWRSPALRPPAKEETSAAVHESAPSPTRSLPGVPRAAGRQESAPRPARYPACLARRRRRAWGRCGRRKRRRRGESPRPHGSRSPTRACTRSPRLRTLGGPRNLSRLADPAATPSVALA